MGLLEKLKSPSKDLDAAEGVTGIVYCAVAADGIVTQDEMQAVATSLSRMTLFQELSQKQVTKGFEKVVKIAQNEGVDTLLKRSADAVPPELSETTFAIAVDILLSDGDVPDAEVQFLGRIQQALDVEESIAERIIEVLEIKNRG